MARLKLHLLGSFEATLDGKPVEGFRSNKSRALLAYLMVEDSRPHSRDWLAALLWGDKSEKAARLSLRVCLSNLRAILGPLPTPTDGSDACLSITRQAVQGSSTSSHCSVDVAEFDALWAACQNHLHHDMANCPACVQRLALAVELYRGDLLQDLLLPDSPGFDEWLLLQQEARHQHTLSALRILTNYYTSQGRFEEGQSYARQQIALEPWHEEAHRNLIKILAASGRRAAALSQYDTCRQVLAEELGVLPSVETTALYERLLSAPGNRQEQVIAGLGPDLRASSQPQIVGHGYGSELGEEEPYRLPPWPPSADLHNMPLQLAPFMGREAELEHLSELLLDPTYRLLTLVGPGGVGKTRLALAAAEEAMAAFGEGVWYVPLDNVEPAPNSRYGPAHSDLVTSIAQALNLPFLPRADRKTQLLDYLRQRPMLLLLDGFEQLGNEAVDFLLNILSCTLHVQMLVTSRTSLNLRAEYAVRLDGLSVPDPALVAAEERDAHNMEILKQYPCVQLFAERAARRPTDFLLDEDTLPGVVAVCRQVGGLPLGIELAASQIENDSPEGIAQAISQDLDVLSTSMRDVDVRHRSMRAVFDASWRSLTVEERFALAHASVFRGGFGQHAASTITALGIRTSKVLESLVDKSLLHQTTTGRYEMQELLRAFAAQKLGAPNSVSRAGSSPSSIPQFRHSAYYLDFLERREAALNGRRPTIACSEIGYEWQNIKQAWAWAASQALSSPLASSLPALARYVALRGLYEEGEGLLEQAIEPLTDLSDSRSLALHAILLVEQARMANNQDHSETASWVAQQAITLAHRLGDKEIEGQARLQAGLVLTELGDPNRAREELVEALALSRDAGRPEIQAAAHNGLGRVARAEGAWTRAERHYREALDVARGCDDWSTTAQALYDLSEVAWKQGDADRAARHAEESLLLYRELEDRQGICDALHNLGIASGMQGNHQMASQCFTQNLVTAQELGDQQGVAKAFNNLGYTAYTQKQYQEAAYYFQEALAVAKAAGLRHLQANALSTLGLIHTAMGNSGRAWNYLRAGLLESTAFGIVPSTLNALVGVSWLRAQSGDYEQAAELLGLALDHPSLEADIKQDAAGPVLSALGESLPAAQLDAALSRGGSADLEAIVAGILAAYE